MSMVALVWKCKHYLFWGRQQENLIQSNKKEQAAFYRAPQEPDEEGTDLK